MATSSTPSTVPGAAPPMYSADIMPPFTGENISHWLNLCNYAFKVYKISADQQIYLLYRSLPSEMQLELSSILDSDGDKMKLLKEGIIKATDLPAQRRLEKLLNEAELGDRKPSAFLRHLRQLAGPDETNAKLLRSIFLSRLPKTISQILAPMSNKPLDDLAEYADQIYEYMPQSRSLNSCELSSSFSSPDVFNLNKTVSSIDQTSQSLLSVSKALSNSLADFQSQFVAMQNSISSGISNLQSQMSMLQSRLNRDQSRSRSRTQFNRSSNVNSNLCYYHSKFGNKATKCTQPCTWQQPLN